jgi:hypothetical protein
MDLGERVCHECLEKERYCMEVEFEHPELDFGVLTDDNLHDLLIRYKIAKLKGFDSYLGSCPKMKILSVKDVITGELIDPNRINEILEEL